MKTAMKTAIHQISEIENSAKSLHPNPLINNLTTSTCSLSPLKILAEFEFAMLRSTQLLVSRVKEPELAEPCFLARSRRMRRLSEFKLYTHAIN